MPELAFALLTVCITIPTTIMFAVLLENKAAAFIMGTIASFFLTQVFIRLLHL